MTLLGVRCPEGFVGWFSGGRGGSRVSLAGGVRVVGGGILYCMGTTTVMGLGAYCVGIVEEVLYLVEGMFFPAVFNFYSCVS